MRGHARFELLQQGGDGAWLTSFGSLVPSHVLSCREEATLPGYCRLALRDHEVWYARGTADEISAVLEAARRDV